MDCKVADQEKLGLSSRWTESSRKKTIWRFWKKTSSSQQQVWVVALSSNTTTTQNIRGSWWRTAQSPDLNPIENLWDEQKNIKRSLRDLPKNNGMGFLRRRVWDLLKTRINNCRLLSSKKDTQLTISIKGLIILTVVIWGFCEILFLRAK